MLGCDFSSPKDVSQGPHQSFTPPQTPFPRTPSRHVFDPPGSMVHFWWSNIF